MFPSKEKLFIFVFKQIKCKRLLLQLRAKSTTRRVEICWSLSCRPQNFARSEATYSALQTIAFWRDYHLCVLSFYSEVSRKPENQRCYIQNVLCILLNVYPVGTSLQTGPNHSRGFGIKARKLDFRIGTKLRFMVPSSIKYEPNTKKSKMKFWFLPPTL